MTVKIQEGSLSSAPHGKLIDFNRAEIRKSEYNGDTFLYVEGDAADTGWSPTLAPRIYHQKPDYLVVEVLKVRILDSNTINTPINDNGFQLSIPINDIIGRKGVKLVGKNSSRTIDL